MIRAGQVAQFFNDFATSSWTISSPNRFIVVDTSAAPLDSLLCDLYPRLFSRITFN
jgi:hypothetical protein